MITETNKNVINISTHLIENNSSINHNTDTTLESIKINKNTKLLNKLIKKNKNINNAEHTRSNKNESTINHNTVANCKKIVSLLKSPIFIDEKIALQMNYNSLIPDAENYADRNSFTQKHIKSFCCLGILSGIIYGSISASNDTQNIAYTIITSLLISLAVFLLGIIASVVFEKDQYTENMDDFLEKKLLDCTEEAIDKITQIKKDYKAGKIALTEAFNHKNIYLPNNIVQMITEFSDDFSKVNSQGKKLFIYLNELKKELFLHHYSTNNLLLKEKYYKKVNNIIMHINKNLLVCPDKEPNRVLTIDNVLASINEI